MVLTSSLALVLPLLPQATDADPQLAADVRCFTVLSYAVSQTSEDKRARVAGGVMYYVGKIDGRRPGYDLQGAVLAMAKDEAALAAMLPTELKRCGAELSSKGEALKRLGPTLRGAAAGK